MVAKKLLRSFLILLFCIPIFSLHLSYGAVPGHYQEKRIFYDSLSIVLNKYIVPVDNWSLFTGTLQGLQDLIGPENLRLIKAENQIEVKLNDNPGLLFNRDRIDMDAIELVESFSKIFDAVFTESTIPDKKDIINAAIRGMVGTLEPNSYFINQEDLDRIQAQNQGFFEGVGLEITSLEGIVTVISPYEGTPAFRVGIAPHDRILAIDGTPTKGMHLMDVSRKIRGRKGEPVTLTIERVGCNAPRDIVLVRETISHKTVKYREPEPGFGYIRIMNFLGNTDDDFAAALKNLTEDSSLKGLIIDLRYNPGGLLNQSLTIADFFLDSGIIALTESRIKSDNKTFYARPATLPSDFPIVILINGGSASGSEIVAAALRSHERAVLVGKRTFGKGYMQTIFPLPTDGAIRLTTSMVLTPDGKKIQNVGIEPDLQFNPMAPDNNKRESPDRSPVSTLETGSIKGDPEVQVGLDILKRALLLQKVSEEELEGLSQEKAVVKKRFRGLIKALEEVQLQSKTEAGN